MGRLQVFEEPGVRREGHCESKARRDQSLVSGIGDVLRLGVSKTHSIVVPAHDLTSKSGAKEDSKRRGACSAEVCEAKVSSVGRS